MDDLISRQGAIDAVMNTEPLFFDFDTLEPCQKTKDVVKAINDLPSAQPERTRMSNKEWIDFLVVQFDISRTSAKEMLHGMMKMKKEDNFKRDFNPLR